MDFFNDKELKKFLKVLEEEKESADYNLDYNRALLSKGNRKKGLIKVIIAMTETVVLTNSSTDVSWLRDVLELKKEEIVVFKNFLNGIEENIKILEKLKDLKEKEIKIYKDRGGVE